MLNPQVVLNEAQKQLIEFDAQTCVDYVQKNFPELTATPLALQALVLTLAYRVRERFPQAALDLLEFAHEFPDKRDAILTFKASLLDHLGRGAEAREVAASVVRDIAAGPEQRLTAAKLLIRTPDGSMAAEVASGAFQQLGRPLKHAAGLFDIALQVADWGLVAQIIDQLQKAIVAGKATEAAESPRNHVLWCASERDNIAVCKHWARRFANYVPLAHVDELQPLEGRRLRVGYLSSDFREHPTSRLINGLFRHHDRSRFELFMYCSGWDDGSPMRREIESHFDHRHSVSSLSDDQAARLICSHGIDVLVELNGPTRAQRLGILACRPAPVQIGYLGWPGTYGGELVDYIVADSYVIPEGVETLYPEKIIRIASTYQINDCAAKAPLEPVDRQPSDPSTPDVLVLGMFNAINKVRGDVWSVWMQILKQVPEAVLWMLDPGPLARDNIARATRDCGVDPARIMAAPPATQDTHLARLQCCDLMLDPWPYGGHTSTTDALFAGVPVIALEGSNFASRANGSLLHAAGLGSLVQPDTESYIRTVVGLLKNKAELARLKAYVREQVPHSDVFNAQSKTRQIETAYLHAYQRCYEGKPPMHIRFGRTG